MLSSPRRPPQSRPTPPQRAKAAAASLDRCPNPSWAQAHTHLSHLRQQPREASPRQAAAGHGGQASGTGPTSMPGTRGGGRSRRGLSASGTSLFSTRSGSSGCRELRNGPSSPYQILQNDYRSREKSIFCRFFGSQGLFSKCAESLAQLFPISSHHASGAPSTARRLPFP